MNMLIRIKNLFLKYLEAVLYVFFGACTTALNQLTYYILHTVLGVSNVSSTAAAWLLSVIFAFITNKLWVFESKSFGKSLLFREFGTFVGARLLTGILDVSIMYIGVDRLHFNDNLCKLGSNVIVIVLNYIFSKLVIFRKNRNS